MDDTQITYSYNDAYKASLRYFDGDELAAKTVVDKYLLRNVHDGGEADYYELDPDAMHKRLANEFERIDRGYLDGYSAEDYYYVMKDFQYIVPGGSIQYGCGNPFVNVSLSNCTVLASPEDSLLSISQTAGDMSVLFSARAGVGIDLSNLRPDGARVNNSAGTSTGAWSFADYYSYVCRMVGQRGRRGALMLTLDVRHPDITKFISMKHDRTYATGANVSVRMHDDFMQAVKDDKEYTLQFPVDVPVSEAKYTTVVKACDVWEEITKYACMDAEPGLLLWDNYIRNCPAQSYADVGFNHISTNPCGEIILSANDTCRLTSINLTGFVRNAFTDNAYFDFGVFIAYIDIAMHMLDDIVDLEIEALTKIRDKATEPRAIALWNDFIRTAKRGRRTGLGTHGLADALAMLGVEYGSYESVHIVDAIYRVLRDTSYTSSIELAKSRGAFPEFDWNKEKNNDFILRLPKYIQEAIAKYGRRNIALLTNAPTGSISIESQTSSGIEAVYDYGYMRRKKINPSDVYAKVDYVDKLGDKWQHFMVYHHNLERYAEAHHIPLENLDLKALPPYFVKANDVDPIACVKMQGVIQQYIDHGISRTLNLPKGTKPEQIGKIYMSAWEEGLKGVTVYVDGSRDGVLVKTESSIVEAVPPKRPETLLCDIHHTSIEGVEWLVVVGLLDNKPYEIFAGTADDLRVPRKYKSGTVTKRKVKNPNKRGRYSVYDLAYNGDESISKPEVVVEDIIGTFDDAGYGTMTRHISLELRSGIPVRFITEALSEDANDGLYSFNKVVSRVLKQYIPDGEQSGKLCSECGATLRYEDGCVICMQCGYGKCS